MDGGWLGGWVDAVGKQQHALMWKTTHLRRHTIVHGCLLEGFCQSPVVLKGFFGLHSPVVCMHGNQWVDNLPVGQPRPTHPPTYLSLSGVSHANASGGSRSVGDKESVLAMVAPIPQVTSDPTMTLYVLYMRL